MSPEFRECPVNMALWGRHVVLGLVALTMTAALWPVGSGDSAPTGERLYGKLCADCHGGDGAGGIGVSLNSEGHIHTHTCAQLKIYIALGSRGSGYMPSHAGTLSPKEMCDIILSLARWWTEDQVAEFHGRTKCPGQTDREIRGT